MNYKEAKELADKLTLLNKSKLSLYAAELVYPIYKKYDEDDTVVIAAINATIAYIENPCKEAADAAWSAANAAWSTACAAVRAAWSAANAACAAANAACAAANAAANAAFAAWSAANAAYTATDATRAAAHAAFADWSAANAAYTATDAACKADDTIETKIRDYAAKLIAEQGE